MIDCCLRSVEIDDDGNDVVERKITGRLGFARQWRTLAIVSDSHDRCLAYARLSTLA